MLYITQIYFSVTSVLNIIINIFIHNYVKFES